jgi:nucleoside-diphosphate-sugar epimerase
VITIKPEKMKILVTGATGYIGNRLAQTLAEAGNMVHILVRDLQSANLPLHTNIKVFAGDITDIGSIARAIDGCTQVYHAAAMTNIYTKDPSAIFEVNVSGTQNMLTVSKEARVEKLVFTSTCSVFGPSILDPTREDDKRIIRYTNNYEKSKSVAENLVKEYSSKGLQTVTVDLTKVFGPGIETHAMSVNRVIRDFIAGKICVHPMPSSIISNYVFIDDAVKGHILAMQKGISGEKYIIGGENVSYTDFFDALRNITGTYGRVIAVPKFIALAIGWLNLVKGNITGKDPFFTHKEAKLIYFNRAFSSRKAHTQFGYEITPFTNALRQTISFFKTRKK